MGMPSLDAEAARVSKTLKVPSPEHGQGLCEPGTVDGKVLKDEHVCRVHKLHREVGLGWVVLSNFTQ